MIEFGICIFFLILYLVLLHNLLCTICSTNERNLTSCSDVETPPVSLQVNTENNPYNPLSHSVASQIAEDNVNQISEEHLDDNNNSSFCLTTSLGIRTNYEPVFKVYSDKTRTGIDLHFITWSIFTTFNSWYANNNTFKIGRKKLQWNSYTTKWVKLSRFYL